jgi:predicted PurR-regulated permease PerM
MRQLPDPRSFTQRTLVAVGISLAVLLLLLALGYLAEILLLVFAAVLLAVVLRSATDLLTAYARIPQGISLALVLLGFLVLLVLGVWRVGPVIAEGIYELVQVIPRSVEQVRAIIEGNDWAERFLAGILEDDVMVPGDALARLAGVFSTAVGAVISLLFTLLLGLYFSVQPQLYLDGVVRLVPPAHRTRAREVIRHLGYVMRWWLLGRLLTMALVGVATWIGLRLLGVPLAMTLALLSGLLTFVPVVGPIVATVPAAIMALTVEPILALYVIILYLIVQNVESALLTPLILHRVVAMPPAFLLSFQLILSVTLGIVGLVLAAPLAVVVMVLVQLLYIEDVLGDRPRPSEQGKSSL